MRKEEGDEKLDVGLDDNNFKDCEQDTKGVRYWKPFSIHRAATHDNI